MQALCQVHMKNNELTPRQFFRSAYMWKFGKDISDLSLTNDTKLFDERGKVPPYVVDYLIQVYGCQ